MIREVLLSFGLVMYSATQLRFGGAPVGVGELCFVGWIGLTLLHRLFHPVARPNPVVGQIFAFWLILTMALCLGMIVGLLVEPFQDFKSIAHDVAAYALLAVISVLLASDLEEDGRRRRTVWLVVAFGTAVFFVQVVDGYGIINMPGTDPWFFDRFRGWALDPNQLGFIAATLTLLSIHLMESSEHVAEKIAALTFGASAMAVGIMTKSDSYVVCILVAGVVLLAANGWKVLSRPGRPLRLRDIFVIGALAILPLATIAVAPFTRDVLAYAEVESTAVYEDDGQGDTRLALWSEAIHKGLESKLLGFGPGPHLTSKSYKRPPPDKFEAHNTTLDLFTQGGIVAGLLFISLCAFAFAKAWRAALPALAALAIGFAVFSMFHFVIRHPIFWFGSVLCLLEAARAARPSPAVAMKDARLATC